MSILSKNVKLVLGSTAVAVVLSGTSAFSADTVNGSAYTHSSGSVASITGGTYTASTTGSGRAWGVLVHNNSTLNLSATEVTTTGNKAHGIQVGQFGDANATGTDMSVINLTAPVTVNTSGNDSFGLHAIDGGKITGAAKIDTKGKNGFGAFAESSSEIALSGATITTDGVNAHGIIANNDKNTDAGVISAKENTTITTKGVGASGAYADKGGSVTLTDSTITTTGAQAHGAQALSGAQIDITGGKIETGGTQARGIQAHGDGTKVTATDVEIITTGGQTSNSGAEGVRAHEKSSVTLNGGSVTTSGDRGYGLLAINGATIESSADITTKGAVAHGVQAGGAGTDAATYNGSTKATVNLTGGTITIDAKNGTSWGTGLHSVDQSMIDADAIIIKSKSYGAIAETASTIKISNSTVTTTGNNGHALIASNDRKKDGKDANAIGGTLDVSNTDVITKGDNAAGVVVTHGATATVTGGSITTGGLRSDGVYAETGGSVTLSGTTIETNGAQARGIQAQDKDTSVTAAGVNITTKGGPDSGAGSEGVRAQNEAIVTLNDSFITTKGDRAYGVIALDNATITLTNTDITTSGNTAAHGVQAGGFGTTATQYDGSSKGTVNLTGGTITIDANNGAGWGAALHSVDHSTIDAKNIIIISKSYGAIAETASTIKITGSKVTTSGDNNSALIANNDRFKTHADAVGGTLIVTDTTVKTSGANAHGVLAANGGAVSVTGGSITTTGANASAVVIVGSGTVDVTGTALSSANAATASVLLSQSTDVANITFGNGTVATTNNGTLLFVDRAVGGLDGRVNFTLKAGSESTGNILDEKANDKGFTNLTVEKGAKWTGSLKGIKDLAAQAGSIMNFGAGTAITGNLSGTASTFTFDATGGSIGGDFKLNQGSKTAGGSGDTPITVGGSVMVDGTSQMGGNWQITGNLTSSGSITPGNSIGSVTVGGDLILDTNSTYEVEINKDGKSDRIDVGGTAILGGNVNVTPLAGYQLGHAYTILTAGSFGGSSFIDVRWNEGLIFITPKLNYTGEDAPQNHETRLGDMSVALPKREVQLTLDRSDVAFSSVAQTSNQAATADALDSLKITNPLMGSVALLDASGARQAFEQLSGDTYASNKTGLIETAHLTADAINARLRNAFEGVAASDVPVLSYAKTPKSAGVQAIDSATPAQPSNEYAVWATGFGSWIDQSGSANAGGVKTSVGGFLSGIDLGLASGWRLGVAGGYSKTDLDSKGRSASANSDNWHLGIYGGNQWDALGLRLGLVQSWHSIDASRSAFGDSLSADYNARLLQAFGEIGYRIDTAAASFEPFANLSHVRLRTNGFTEQGGNTALSVEKDTTNTTFTTLGLRAAAPVELGATPAKLTGTLGWRHAYSDVTPTSTQAFAGSNAFTVDGVAIAKDVAIFGAGFEVEISKISTFGVNYTGQYGNGAKQNGFNATLNVKF